jgi:hypothetical protein
MWVLVLNVKVGLYFQVSKNIFVGGWAGTATHACMI